MRKRSEILLLGFGQGNIELIIDCKYRRGLLVELLQMARLKPNGRHTRERSPKQARRRANTTKKCWVTIPVVIDRGE